MKKDFPDQEYFKNRKWEGTPKEIVSSVVKEILDITLDKQKKKVKALKILDVGSGAGDYSFEFSKYVKKVVGVEPYKEAYREALVKKRKFKSKALFVNKSIEDYVSEDKFDIVLSLTTVEHMPNVEESFARIFQLLKSDGIIYLTAPNKWWPYENHYRLFFLSWLPLPLANLYVRITKRGTSYIDSAYSKSYFGMKKLFDKFPCTYKFVLPKDLKSPYIGCGESGIVYVLVKKLGLFLIKNFSVFWIFSKGFIMVIEKQ